MADQSGVSRSGGEPLRRVAVRWRWYHYYFLLALFDLAVILGSLALYHASLESYRGSLRDLADLRERQLWIQDVRSATLSLNAPGNDVFETREIGAEQARYLRERRQLERLLEREGELGLDLSEFRGHLDRMVRAEEGVLDTFEELAAIQGASARRQALLDKASASMASMDRHQAEALDVLVRVEQEDQRRELTLLDAYGRGLEQSARIERYLLALVIVILAAVFWFGRKLQGMHEQMVLDRQRAMEEFHARLSAVGEVCATVAHNIRNPLSGIRAAAQIAREQGPGPQIDESLGDIIGAVDRLNQRLRRLLDFSRPLAAEPRPVEVGSLIEDVLGPLRPRATAMDVKVSMETAGPIRASLDPDLLGECLTELAGNALDAMPNGGSLRIRAERRRAALHIRVSDSGAGIPEAVRHRLFRLFFTTRPEGTGMGLATVKRMMELQGGDIELESTGPDGTAFRLTLPVDGKRRAERVSAD